MSKIIRLAATTLIAAAVTVTAAGIASAANVDEQAYIDDIVAAIPELAIPVQKDRDGALRDGYQVCAALRHGISPDEVATALQQNFAKFSRGQLTITFEQAQQYVSAADRDLCQ